MARDVLSMLGSTSRAKVTKPEPRKHSPSTTLVVLLLFDRRWKISSSRHLISNLPKHNTLEAKSVKVALFDLDYTLVKTLTGARFPRGKDDWRWWNLGVAKQLEEYSKDHLVVIFSNQGAVVAKQEAKLYQNFIQRVNGVVAGTKLERVVVYAAPKNQDKLMRKPDIGMWRELEEYLTKAGCKIDIEGLFFVGDAAGRPGDHSDSDKIFAENVGVKFKTPEEVFRDQDP